jgi:hypothetical protein
MQMNLRQLTHRQIHHPATLLTKLPRILTSEPKIAELGKLGGGRDLSLLGVIVPRFSGVTADVKCPGCSCLLTQMYEGENVCQNHFYRRKFWLIFRQPTEAEEQKYLADQQKKQDDLPKVQRFLDDVRCPYGDCRRWNFRARLGKISCSVCNREFVVI